MTEPISFGANGYNEKYRCDRKIWIYPQQNKGRITNLIINQTKMTNIRDLIEKIWWVIPPIIIVFGIPLYFTIDEMIEFSRPASLFLSCYGENFPILIDIAVSFGPFGGIVAIFTFGFMGIGYYLVRKQPSLLWRIIIVLVLGIIGFVAGLFTLLILGGLLGAIH